ncbi:hypothetical protein Xsto_03475 [Xenorhabdus stockiae]|uniref:Uncharacterized protein n=1 Tax=Xenorhabdus stockiae TaxID=351614 RepID=A0A2D0KKU7_9GAMM|nr:hypothetical protein [Xenorhabdus stockiae]PHM63945.1 hypothetical protein Xsto_03475 [Xenorhabdus stockiae]
MTSTNLDTRKKTEKMQLRTTEYLKDQVCRFADKDGISQNSILNQAIAWYAEERNKNES